MYKMKNNNNKKPAKYIKQKVTELKGKIYKSIESELSILEFRQLENQDIYRRIPKHHQPTSPI